MTRSAGVATTTTASTTTAATTVATTTASGVQCGVERWAVKTLSDPSASGVNFTGVAIAIQALRELPAPGGLSSNTPRTPPYEYSAYTVQAFIKGAVMEDDHDIHIVLADLVGGGTMIAELPDVGCAGATSSPKKDQMASARAAFVTACGAPTSSYKELHGTVTVTGVAFFDEMHGQTGVAPNGIELHPVTAFAAVSCAAGPAPVTTTTVATTVATSTAVTTAPSVQPKPKAKLPKCKRGHRSTKKHPCRK